ncbi:MAG: glutamine-synthetase adenylyltransferase [Bryobacteraceae bacterium]|nr:glutamine-synthetase adenylyltransferase [Bryobacterales bacterium]MEB2363077.1 glutamine-synthetase adenylyltransferase [Bryobacterales bacterium]NUM99616.1 glutamine-synthetase adenylyltransferase [Bryobacteraceae bacterium]
MRRLVEGVEFQDRARAISIADRFAGALTPTIEELIRYLLSGSADPDSALHWLDCLYSQKRMSFEKIVRSPVALQYFVTVASHSRFLGEAVVQQPEWLEELPQSGDLHRVLSSEELEERLDKFLSRGQSSESTGRLPRAPDGTSSLLELARFRRKNILRILLRDVMAFTGLAEVTEDLSNLADAVLDLCYLRIRTGLVERYGTPRYTDPSGRVRECGFSVIALGKLGGRELNYSSDIDLMFLYSGPGETSGPNSISNKEFFKKVANELTTLLSTYTAEGMCYRVDLRLRPDGRFGEVCMSVDGAKSYYQNRARDWELQMLIKARVAAGERAPGRELLSFVEPIIYSTTLDFSAVESVSATRERIAEKLQSRRSQAAFDIKLAPGGIRDIEFLVQCLQRLHGGREAWVRHGGTLQALFRLHDKGLLSGPEYGRLASAYQFLRALEHRLQFYEDRQTHALPTHTQELEILSRRMPASEVGRAPSAENLLRTLNRHLEEVQIIYERVIHAQNPTYYTAAVTFPAAGVREEASVTMNLPEKTGAPEMASNLIRFLDQKAPGLAAVLAQSPLKRSMNTFELFLERVLPNSEWMRWLDSDAVLTGYLLDLFDHSPYFAEQMVRTPDLLSDLMSMRERPGRDPRYTELAAVITEATALRRFFRREMFRIQAESVCTGAPIFSTLVKTSELTDVTISTAYRMAVNHVLSAKGPQSADYAAKDQLLVIALGRLGMREFDLASDADLVFVLPDADAGELVFWTRVAERLIDILTAYTGEGVMFAVDTRLRPNGREGALVQLERTYKEYFAERAEAWEGITYMKSLAVAGDLERGTQFLNSLQEVDWRRYGQSGRSKKLLRQMRMRLEKEQGAANPLKAGPGGYYDIDFSLMFLRLKGAGIFFKVLNTPQRIEVIEKMGHLERNDAIFLNDAATLYRAVDHGLRVFTGHAEGDLPYAASHLEVLTELVKRWTPEHLHDQPLRTEVEQIRSRTRDFFDRLFA